MRGGMELINERYADTPTQLSCTVPCHSIDYQSSGRPASSLLRQIPSRNSEPAAMGKAAGLCFTFALLVEVGCSCWSALWPLRDHLTLLKRFRTALELYSPAESNLDVLLLSVSHSLFLIFEVCIVAGRGRSRAVDKSWCGPLAKFICACSQVWMVFAASSHIS